MTVRVVHGDCLAVLPTLPADSVDACVTDPPYHLTNRTPDVKWCVECHRVTGGADGKPSACPKCNGRLEYQRSQGQRGFMGKQWDGGDVAFRRETWAVVWGVLKPGAHLVAFGAPRNYHRMACAIEDAGFEIRDSLLWLYGSGFPKSHNAGNGWGTALKPAYEPIILARKPLIGTVAANVLAHGTGALNIDGCRVPAADRATFPAGIVSETEQVFGGGKGRYADNPRGADSNPTARWPANVIHDGSEEVLRAFPETASPRANGNPNERTKGASGMFRAGEGVPDYRDTGSAARFFYTSKADAADRLQSKHPTVKPVDLIAYLCRLITPPGGVVLDPFAGSGTTGMACMREGFNAILIEREAEYVADIQRRLQHVSGQDAPLFARTEAGDAA